MIDFFHAVQGNVTNWICKMERNGMTTLAAHGEDLFGSEGAKATIRAELQLDLKLNMDAWKALSGPATHCNTLQHKNEMTGYHIW